MSEWQSNIPDGLDLSKQYVPAKTEAEKEQARQRSLAWRQTLADNPEVWQDWYNKNSERFNDPSYVEKLSASITQFYIDNPSFQQEKVNSLEWKKAHAEGCRKYVEDPNYVNPRGMLNKTHTEDWKEFMSALLSGVPKPKEGNQKISNWRKDNWSPKQESIDKMRKTLTGRESGRSRRVQTPAGIFNKLKDAADFYGVSTGAVKNWLNKTTDTISKKDVRDRLVAKGVVLNDNGFPQGFAWLGDAQTELGAKRVCTLDGIFENVNEAAKHYGITPTAIRARCTNEKNKDFRYDNT